MADQNSTPTHTPGPWAWDSRNGEDYLVSCAPHPPHTVVLGFLRTRLIPDDPIGDSDRALIAAAPDLLAALKALSAEASWFLSMASAETHGHTNIAVLRHWIDSARTAIREAEGSDHA